MSKKNLMVLLVSVFALAALSVQFVSAAPFGEITRIDVNGEDIRTADLALFGGEVVRIDITFKAKNYAEDVEAEVWISGEDRVKSRQTIDALVNKTYTLTANLEIPADIDDDFGSDIEKKLNILVDAEDIADGADSIFESHEFTAQRGSHELEILSVNMQSEVSVGEALVVDIVLKNRGRQSAEDAFVTISIPELGLEQRTYFGDLTPVDQDDPDKEDAVERRTVLRIPSNVEPGLYTVTVETFEEEGGRDTVERRVLIGGGAEENTVVVSASQSKNFGVGETATYQLTLVNRGSTVRVFTLSVDSPANLNVELSDALVVVPAGSSRTIEIDAMSDIRDEYTFTVEVQTEDGALVEQKSFRANVEDGSTGGSVRANTTVLLTVILAIIFIVLLVVLIVLLTRKPATKEEFGESYY